MHDIDQKHVPTRAHERAHRDMMQAAREGRLPMGWVVRASVNNLLREHGYPEAVRAAVDRVLRKSGYTESLSLAVDSAAEAGGPQGVDRGEAETVLGYTTKAIAGPA